MVNLSSLDRRSHGLNRRCAALLIFMWCGTLLTSAAGAVDLSRRVQFDIPAQPLSTALLRFSEQAAVQLAAPSTLLQGVQSAGIRGEHPMSAALDALLRGTGLTFQALDERTVAIRRESKHNSSPGYPNAVATDERGSQTGTNGRDHSTLAQAAAPASPAKVMNPDAGEHPEQTVHLGEVVVTGTHIRGQVPVGSNLITIDRAEIDKTGFATAVEVVRSLPQNFRGGPGEETSLGRDAANNFGFGASGLNLRGLGAGATLVLIDGRRMAAGGAEGTFTDVSGIPLSAIERIEVLPDGASATYGADAVGGVVNFILRRDYKGAETRVFAGSVTDGDMHEYQISQAFGGTWGSDSSGLLTYEFYKRDALPTSARRLSANSDLTPFGGTNWSSQFSNPGTISTGVDTWAIPRGQNGRSLDPASLVSGTFNLQNELEGRDLLPEQRRHSVFATVRNDINPRIAVFADGLYTRRTSVTSTGAAGLPAFLVVPSTNPFYVNPTGGTDPIFVMYNLIDDLGSPKADFNGDSYLFAAGTTIDVGRDWSLDLTATYGRSESEQRAQFLDNAAIDAALADPNPATAFNPFGDGSFTNPTTLAGFRAFTSFSIDSDIRALRLVADGPLVALAAGDLRLAVGAEHNRPSFRSVFLFPASGADIRTDGERRVDAAFVELFVPLVGAENTRSGMQRLDLSLAGRYEDYSDFGRATTPKVGLTWSPAAGFSLRGNWSKSFKAPYLTDLDENNNVSFIFDFPDPLSPTGTSPLLLWGGKNAGLVEERATVWSIGADFAPVVLPGTRIALTYFDIAFKHRIEDPPFGSFLEDPTLGYLLARDPTLAQRQRVCDFSTFFGAPADCLNAPIAAIVDLRTRNTAINDIAGLDLIGNYVIESSVGEFSVGINGTYYTKFDRQGSPTFPIESLVNTATNPMDLRVRGSVSWTHGRWAATSFVNYQDSYRDVVAERRVDSWTTADLQVSYSIEKNAGGWFDDSTIALNVQNVFDSEPPFYDNPAGFQGYDPQNATNLGRLVSLQISKGW